IEGPPRSHAPPPHVTNDLELAETVRPRGDPSGVSRPLGGAIGRTGGAGSDPAPLGSMTRGGGTPALLRVTASSCPIGSAVLDERPRRASVPPLIVQALGLLVALGVGALVYQWWQRQSEAPMTGTPVRGTFHSDRLGATLHLPGAGWREQAESFDGKLPQLG